MGHFYQFSHLWWPQLLLRCDGTRSHFLLLKHELLVCHLDFCIGAFIFSKRHPQPIIWTLTLLSVASNGSAKPIVALGRRPCVLGEHRQCFLFLLNRLSLPVFKHVQFLALRLDATLAKPCHLIRKSFSRVMLWIFHAFLDYHLFELLRFVVNLRLSSCTRWWVVLKSLEVWLFELTNFGLPVQLGLVQVFHEVSRRAEHGLFVIRVFLVVRAS